MERLTNEGEYQRMVQGKSMEKLTNEGEYQREVQGKEHGEIDKRRRITERGSGGKAWRNRQTKENNRERFRERRI